MTISRDISNTMTLAHSVAYSCGTTLPIYGTVEGADNFFALLLEGEKWGYLSKDKKVRCLVSATKRIDQLNFAGGIVQVGQILQFPRGTDTLVPGDIAEATYWLALAFANGVDPDTERDNLFMTTQAFGGLRTEFGSRVAAPIHIVNGIPCPTAWNLLLPYLQDNRGLTIRRVS